MQQTIAEGKPADKAKIIVNGRINKLMSETTLLGQQFVKDQNKTIAQYIKENNLKILNFIRFEVGEGTEKPKVNFAQEVADQIKKNK
jgi:elongation factor Ts